MKGVTLALLALALLPAVLGAELSGTIYDQDLRKAENVLVLIDTTPQQRLLATDGTYTFTLPPGNYTLRAQYTARGTNYTTTETVIVRDDGAYTYDLFLFPTLDEELPIDEEPLEDPGFDIPDSQEDPMAILARLLLVLAVIGFAYFAWRMVKPKQDGDELAETILAEIRKAGGRMTQKELRQKLPHSEAAVSLAVTELAQKGRIEKLKKGRGNILKVK